MTSRSWLAPLRSLRAQIIAFAAIVALLAFIPLWVARAFPAPYQGARADESGALRAVLEYRSDLIVGNVAAACAMTEVQTTNTSSCTTWTDLQIKLARATKARSRARAHGGPLIDDIPLHDVALLKIGLDKNIDRTIYTLVYTGGPPHGTISNESPSLGTLAIKGSDVEVILTDGQAADSPGDIGANGAWFYEMRASGSRWLVHATNDCSGGRRTLEGTYTNRCISAVGRTKAEIAALLDTAERR